MEDRYLPVDPDFYDVIDSVKNQNISIQVHYFGFGNDLNEAKGVIKGVVITSNHEEYLSLDSGDNVRLDRIIVLNGKPGPAFDEYDSYALACLDCPGGMD